MHLTQQKTKGFQVQGFKPFGGGGNREAKLEYLSGDYIILEHGDFVRCAVTHQIIPLEQLRYWDARVQEAYASADISFKRHRELEGQDL